MQYARASYTAAPLGLALSILLVSVSGCEDDSASTTSGPTGATTSSTGGSGGNPTTTTSGGQGGSGGVTATLDPASDVMAVYGAAPHRVDVSWTASPTATVNEYLVARSSALPAAGDKPADGMTYTAGDTLSNGATVVALETSASASDIEPSLAGDYWYSVYATDGSVWSDGAVGTVTVVVNPAQPGQIEVTAINGTPTVTVNTQPPSFTLSGTAVYQSGQQTLTVSLTVQNDAPRILFNTKARIDMLGQGAVDTTTANAGTLADVPVLWYGPAALDVAATEVRDIVITGVDGNTDPLVIDLTMLNNPALLASGGFGDGVAFIDASGAIAGAGSAPFEGVPAGSTAFGYTGGNGDSAFLGRALSADAKFLYVGQRNMPQVVTVDTTTMTAVASADLSVGQTGLGHVSDVQLSPDGMTLYAVVTTGDHRLAAGGSNIQGNGANETIDVVRLNPSNMTETGRLTLLSGSTNNARGRNLAMSADGMTGSVAILNEGMVFLVDLANMAIIDADPNTNGDQPVDVSGTSSLIHTTLFDAGGNVICTFRNSNGSLLSIDTTTFATSAIAPPTNATGWKPGSFFESGGLVYHTDKDPNPNGAGGLAVFDIANSMTSEYFTDAVIHAAGFSADGSMLFLQNVDPWTIVAVDPTTFMPVDIDGFSGNGVTILDTVEADFGTHELLTTPF
jgi:hypothetical protein